MPEITRRQFMKGSAVAVGAAVLTACTPAATAVPATQGSSNQPEATKPPSATETPKPVARDKKWPMGDVPRNRTFIFSMGAISGGVHSSLASGFNHQIGNALLYEPCAHYSAFADKTYMWLAESYSYNAKATECTIKFRKGIKWSDGVAFTAKDVASSMERLKRVDGLSNSAVYKAEMDSVTVVDDQTLTVKLNQTDWRFFFKDLTFRFDLGDDTAIMPDHIFKDIKDADLVTFKGYDLAKGLPVVTGPYGVGVSTDQVTNFDLLPSWWAVDTGFVAKEPDVWRMLVIPYTNDTTGAQMFINNEIDEPITSTPLVVASIITQCDHVTTWTLNKPPYGNIDWWPTSVWFNCGQAPTNDKRVRWAISYALDRQQIVDVGMGGAGAITISPFPQYPKLNAYMDGIKDITDKYKIETQDLKKTEALMNDAGYKKNKDGFYADKDGNLPNFDLYGPVPLFGDIAPIIAQQLLNAGFNCQHKSPQDVWAALADGRANLWLFGHGGGTVDPYDTFQLYRKQYVTAEGTSSGNNMARWSDDNFEKLVDEMNNTAMDDPKMKDLFHQIMEIWYDQLPDAPTTNFYHRMPFNTTYWVGWPSVENPYMNAALWHKTAFIVIMNLKATGAA